MWCWVAFLCVFAGTYHWFFLWTSHQYFGLNIIDSSYFGLYWFGCLDTQLLVLHLPYHIIWEYWSEDLEKLLRFHPQIRNCLVWLHQSCRIILKAHERMCSYPKGNWRKVGSYSSISLHVGVWPFLCILLGYFVQCGFAMLLSIHAANDLLHDNHNIFGL